VSGRPRRTRREPAPGLRQRQRPPPRGSRHARRRRGGGAV